MQNALIRLQSPNPIIPLVVMDRPKGALAKALYDKINNDRKMDELDFTSWYRLSPASHLCQKFRTKFVDLREPDDLTLQFLTESRSKSAQVCTQIFHIVARLFLSMFMTQTDVNGFLRRGSMFVLSERQFLRLLTAGGFSPNNFEPSTPLEHSPGILKMLDVGAGDGMVTVRLAKSVIMSGENVLLKVFSTETSWTMRQLLVEKKFTVVDRISDLANLHLIACLNVLDRCTDPFHLLHEIYNALAFNGRVILALVLPYSHYVEKNTSHMPVKPLLPHWPKTMTFEAEVIEFFRQLEKVGFTVESWTKAPYLCEGDLRQSYYWLTDVVVVLSKTADRMHLSCTRENQF